MMKTLKHRFNQAVKQLKQDIDFTDCEEDHTLVIEILEPSCNMNFVTTITKITKEGAIYSKQFSDSQQEDWFESNFSNLIDKWSKEKVCELIEQILPKNN